MPAGMKILMLGWELPPFNSGGLGVACFKLCKALARLGCSIDFAVPYSAQHKEIDFMEVIPALQFSPSQIRQAGGAYESYRYAIPAFEHTSLSHHLPTDLRGLQQQYALAVQKLVRSKKYDLIHANEWPTFEAAALAQQTSNLPIIAHVHATEFDRSGEHHGNPLVHEIEQQGLLLADRIITVSQKQKDIVVKRYRIPASKVEVVHNSIDQEDFAPLPASTTYAYLRSMKQRGYKVVVSTNRLTAQKGLGYLLRAAQKALQKNPKLLFLLCNSGEQYNELVALSAELGISQHVLFAGFVRGRELRDAYEVADVFVMPSVSEPFGIAALEAVGHGNVAVVSKQSGVCEVVKNMLTFDYWDTDQLAEYLVAAGSDGLHQTLQQNASQEFTKFSWHTVAERCEQLYKKQLQKAAA